MRSKLRFALRKPSSRTLSLLAVLAFAGLSVAGSGDLFLPDHTNASGMVRAAPLPLAPPYQQDACPEPNDGYAQACPVNLPAQLAGFLSTPEDLDTYVVRLASPGRLLVSLTGLPGDYDLLIYNSSFQPVQESRQEGLIDEMVEVQIDSAGNYFVFVNSERGDFSPTAPYTLRIEFVGAGASAESAPPEAPPSEPVAEPAPAPPPTQAEAPPEPPGTIQSVSGGRAVVRRANGSAIDGAAPGTVLNPGDSVAAVGGGEVALAIRGSTVTLKREGAVNMQRSERNSDGAVVVVLDNWRGRSTHNVAVAAHPASVYSVFANKIETMARGTVFEVELRDDSTVLIDCVDCDRNKVTAAGQPIGSGERVAVVSTGELFRLKIYDEPPSPEPTPDDEDERRREKEKN